MSLNRAQVDLTQSAFEENMVKSARAFKGLNGISFIRAKAKDGKTSTF